MCNEVLVPLNIIQHTWLVPMFLVHPFDNIFIFRISISLSTKMRLVFPNCVMGIDELNLLFSFSL